MAGFVYGERMANPYCTIAQLAMFFDSRVINALSSDDGSGVQDSTTLQLLLDSAASEFESMLTNRYALPMTTVSLFCTQIVASLAIRLAYGRRSDVPKGVQMAVDWVTKWQENFIAGKVSLPGLSRSGAIPTLTHSGAVDGSSRFDRLPWMDQSGIDNTSNVAGGQAGALDGSF